MIDKEALNQLENDDTFQQLSAELKKLNVFEILGITRTEIRHSNFLAWLLDPNACHGLGDRFLRAFVAKLGQAEQLPQNFSGCLVRREWQHIDLLLLCPEEKYLLCIENKVFSGEHDNQLQRYRDVLEREYPDYTKSFAFLTRDGRFPEGEKECQYWQPVSYTDVLDAIAEIRKDAVITDEVKMLLEHYEIAVRRHIVEDSELERLCREIYDRHRNALDTIFETCKTTSAISGPIEDWCKEKAGAGKLSLDSQFSNNTCTRFTTETIRRLLPPLDSPISGRKTNDIAYYEIWKRNDYFKITLTVCSDNMTEQQKNACAKISSFLKRPDKKENWRWKRLKNWPRHKIQANPETDEFKEEIRSFLDKDWNAIEEFEKELLDQIG